MITVERKVKGVEPSSVMKIIFVHWEKQLKENDSLLHKKHTSRLSLSNESVKNIIKVIL